MIRYGAQTNRPSLCALTDAESARVRAFIVSAKNIKTARARLGVSAATFEAARDCGRMKATTRDKLFEALAREEGTP